VSDDVGLLLLVYVIACTIVAWIAHSQGRSPVAWFAISLLLSPLLGFVGVILSAPRRKP
jgi:hypothetical protein